MGEEHWTVQTAKQRVAEAEDLWRSEKPATQPSRLLQRAEQAARKAEERVAKGVEGIQALDAEYESKRASLVEALEEEREKLRECRINLAHAQDQVGAAGRRARNESENETRRTAERQVLQSSVTLLEQQVAPQLAAAVEAAESGGASDELRQQLQAVMACLTNVHGDMQQVATAPYGRAHWNFDISDEESELPELDENDWRQHYQYHGEWRTGWDHQYYDYRYNYGGQANCYGDWWQYGSNGRTNDGNQRYWPAGGGYEEGDDPRCPKRGRAAGWSSDEMEEQAYDDMHAPEHIEAKVAEQELAAAAAAAGTAEEDAARQQQQQQQLQLQQEEGAKLATMVEAFRKSAEEKGVDITDVDLGAVTVPQLQLLATARLG